MNKFHNLLSRNGDSVLKARAANVAKLAEMSQDSLVKNLEKKKIDLEMKKETMLDMSPDNRYSLRVGKDFNADNWTGEYQNLCIELVNVEIELKIAKDNYSDLFKEIEENK